MQIIYASFLSAIIHVVKDQLKIDLRCICFHQNFSVKMSSQQYETQNRFFNSKNIYYGILLAVLLLKKT